MITSALQTFCGDALAEIRVISANNRGFKQTDSGYFQDFKAAASAIRRYLGQPGTNIYFTLNPVNPELLARSNNRIQERAQSTTADVDVVRRKWLFIDFDPKRPAGISSSESEWKLAREKADAVLDWLQTEYHFPEPILATSGNGWHLNYAIDLPNDEASRALIRNVLKTISSKFSDESVEIDISVFNASRICKLYGTWARKGDHIDERPHRQSAIEMLPTNLVSVPVERLTEVANLAPAEALGILGQNNGKSKPRHQYQTSTIVKRARSYILKMPGAVQGENGSKNAFDVARELTRGFALSIDDALPIMQEWNLHCSPPWSESELLHKLQDAAKSSGDVGYRLANDIRNDSVDGRTFEHEERTAIANANHPVDADNNLAPLNGAAVTSQSRVAVGSTNPPATQRFQPGVLVRCGDRGNFGTVNHDDGGWGVSIHFVSPSGHEADATIERSQVSLVGGAAGDSPGTVIDYETIDSKTFAETDFATTFLIDGIMTEGQPQLYGGPSKSMKTSVLVDQCISLAAGVPFLGRFIVPKAKRVLLLSSESGCSTLKETALRICKAKGISLADLGDQLYWGFRPPQLNAADHIETLKNIIIKDKIDVIGIDPAYLSMCLMGNEAANQFAVGAVLQNLTNLQADTGCTPILAAHFRMHMAPGIMPTLEHVAGAGFGQWARQWVLFNRREAFNVDNPGSHQLLMAFGGSAGHSGAVTLDIEEGRIQSGRVWNVSIGNMSEMREQRENEKDKRKRDQQQRTQESHRVAILRAAKQFPKGETKTAIRNMASMNSKYFEPVFQSLLSSKEIESCRADRGETKKDGTLKTFSGFKLVDPASRGTRTPKDTQGH